MKKLIETLPYESVIKIEGSVLARPKEMINEAQATGEIEVLIEDFQILNKSKSMLPFNIREFQKGKEALRMQYRYLDMRFAEMQRNLRVRSQVMMDIRNFLTKQAGFIEVETPTLFKATPGVGFVIRRNVVKKKTISVCREHKSLWFRLGFRDFFIR